MKNKILAICICIMALLTAACRKEFDHPPLTTISEGEKVSIVQLKSRVKDNPSVYTFTGGDTSLYCTITADESSGSFYRQIFVRDDEGDALRVKLISTGGLYTGDRIRIRLNGVTVKHANNLYTLDSVSTENNIVKVSSGHVVIPRAATIAQIRAGAVNGGDMQSQFVELNGVEFVYEDRGTLLGEPIGQGRKDLILTDCNGYTITLTTSGYANFASKNTPVGNGRIAAIVTRYNNDMRLELRNYNDIQMPNSACTTSGSAVSGTFEIAEAVTEIHENFSSVSDQSELALSGWINYNEKGKTRWRGNLKSVIYKCARASAFGAGEKCVAWLISPPVLYHSGLKFSFKTGVEYYKAGHKEPLMAYVCTDFDGTNFASANWTALENAVYAGESDGSYSGAGGLKSSGVIQMKTLQMFDGYSGNFFVAFKYQGEPGFDSNMYVDDVVVE